MESLKQSLEEPQKESHEELLEEYSAEFREDLRKEPQEESLYWTWKEFLQKLREQSLREWESKKKQEKVPEEFRQEFPWELP